MAFQGSAKNTYSYQVQEYTVNLNQVLAIILVFIFGFQIYG